MEAPSSLYSPTPFAYLDRDLDGTVSPSYSLPAGPRVDHLSTRQTEVRLILFLFFYFLSQNNVTDYGDAAMQ
jgi:hypothetical protein